MKVKVIVVPERETFKISTSHINEIYISKKLKIPKLEYHNAKYAAPFWIDEKRQGVNRVFHILRTYDLKDSTVLVLGNSFIISRIWNKMGQHRKFEYHSLEEFNLVEIRDGILMNYEF